MLLTGISEANKRFEEMQSELRFTEREDLLEVVERDLLFEIFQAKKKNGNPKEEEPSKFVSDLITTLQSWLSVVVAFSVLCLIFRLLICS